MLRDDFPGSWAEEPTARTESEPGAGNRWPVARKSEAAGNPGLDHASILSPPQAFEAACHVGRHRIMSLDTAVRQLSKLMGAERRATPVDASSSGPGADGIERLLPLDAASVIEELHKEYGNMSANPWISGL